MHYFKYYVIVITTLLNTQKMNITTIESNCNQHLVYVKQQCQGSTQLTFFSVRVSHDRSAAGHFRLRVDHHHHGNRS